MDMKGMIKEMNGEKGHACGDESDTRKWMGGGAMSVQSDGGSNFFTLSHKKVFTKVISHSTTKCVLLMDKNIFLFFFAF